MQRRQLGEADFMGTAGLVSYLTFIGKVSLVSAQLTGTVEGTAYFSVLSFSLEYLALEQIS